MRPQLRFSNRGSDQIIAGIRTWTEKAFEIGVRSCIDGIRDPFTLAAATRRHLAFHVQRSNWKARRNLLIAFRNFLSGNQLMEGGGGALRIVPANLVAIGDKFKAIWVTEGYGYYYTANKMVHNRNPVGILSRQAQVPNHCLIPLHSGMGMAFAIDVLCSLRSRFKSFQLRHAVQRFLQLCRDNSKEGYFGGAFEALGIIACLLCPELVQPISSELNDDSIGRFWHGYGRGLYFSPQSVCPIASLINSCIDRAIGEPPDAIGRKNSIAGLAWALTLVNLRDPEVLESFLISHNTQLEGDAFANGVNSALAVWKDWAPELKYAEAICDHDSPSPDLPSETWEMHAKSHCGGNLQRIYGDLKLRNRLQDLFCYQPVLAISREMP